MMAQNAQVILECCHMHMYKKIHAVFMMSDDCID